MEISDELMSVFVDVLNSDNREENELRLEAVKASETHLKAQTGDGSETNETETT
jgi:hypothetical protein